MSQNLPQICTASDLRYTYADAVQICDKFWDTQYTWPEMRHTHPRTYLKTYLRTDKMNKENAAMFE